MISLLKLLEPHITNYKGEIAFIGDKLSFPATDVQYTLIAINPIVLQESRYQTIDVKQINSRFIVVSRGHDITT